MSRLRVFLIAVLVLAFSVGTVAAKQDYWDNFLQVAEVEYSFGKGLIKLDFYPYEYDQLAVVKNGLDTELELDLGIYNNLLLYGYILGHREHLNIVSELKYQFYTTPRFKASALGRVYYVRKDFTTPSIKVLLDTNITDNITLHNALQIYFYESGIVGKHIDNAVKYKINDKHALQARLKIFFVDSPKNSLYDFRLAYRYHINKQSSYYCYTYFDLDNVHLENLLEFRPIDPLTLKLGIVVNTGEWQNNYDSDEEVNELRHWANVQADYILTENITLSGEYRREAAADGYSYLKVGLEYKL